MQRQTVTKSKEWTAALEILQLSRVDEVFAVATATAIILIGNR